MIRFFCLFYLCFLGIFVDETPYKPRHTDQSTLGRVTIPSYPYEMTPAQKKRFIGLLGALETGDSCDVVEIILGPPYAESPDYEMGTKTIKGTFYSYYLKINSRDSTKAIKDLVQGVYFFFDNDGKLEKISTDISGLHANINNVEVGEVTLSSTGYIDIQRFPVQKDKSRNIIIVIAANILVPVALFLAWIIAEYRCRIIMRIVLALACMFLVFWIWVEDTKADLQIEKHRSCLQHMQTLLQKKEEAPVLQALKIYSDIYHKTQSAKVAIEKTNSVLVALENASNSRDSKQDGE